jgi:hypothetical protein
MTAVLGPTGQVHAARDLAQILLADQPQRWRHTIGVARRAERLTGVLATGEVLVTAAWLHDIGHAPAVRDTGFPPLDAARHLRALGWPARLTGLVAHRGEALAVARARGLAAELGGFPRETTAVADALTYADLMVGPDGHAMTVEQRLADVLRRHEPDSPYAAAHPHRAPLLRAAADRITQRLAALEGPG